MSNSSLVSYTRITKNKTSGRNHIIDTITIHCIVGQWTAKYGCDYFATTDRQASANYVVGKDGDIGLSVDEKDRSWCSSSAANDNRAVTIEVASDTTSPYAVTDKAYSSLINLVTDICKRNGIKKLVWSTNKNDRVNHLNGCNMTVHRDYANKSCPGEYLYSRHQDIANKVNERLGDMDNIKLEYDNNYDYRWTVDGNKYGGQYDCCKLDWHYDEKLMNDWEEVLCVNGGLFYTYNNACYACGVEFSRGINNQDINMDAVKKYNNAMCLCCTYDGKLEFKQQNTVVNVLDQYYGVVTGMGLLKDGQEVNWGHDVFSTQFNDISGRTIIAEDYNGIYHSYSFAGTTGKSGLTGKQCIAKCKELGFRNAILMDGGGSVQRRYRSSSGAIVKDIVSTRNIKNAILLYRKKKAVVEKPNEPTTDYKKMYEDEVGKNTLLSEKLKKIKEKAQEIINE